MVKSQSMVRAITGPESVVHRNKTNNFWWPDRIPQLKTTVAMTRSSMVPIKRKEGTRMHYTGLFKRLRLPFIGDIE